MRMLTCMGLSVLPSVYSKCGCLTTWAPSFGCLLKTQVLSFASPVDFLNQKSLGVEARNMHFQQAVLGVHSSLEQLLVPTSLLLLLLLSPVSPSLPFFFPHFFWLLLTCLLLLSSSSMLWVQSSLWNCSFNIIHLSPLETQREGKKEVCISYCLACRHTRKADLGLLGGSVG